MIKFSCQNCGTAYQVSDDKAGKDGKCAKCGAVIHIPGGPAPQAASQPPAPSTGDPLAAAAAAIAETKKTTDRPAASDRSVHADRRPTAPKKSRRQPAEEIPDEEIPDEEIPDEEIPFVQPVRKSKLLFVAIGGIALLLAAAGVTIFLLLCDDGNGAQIAIAQQMVAAARSTVKSALPEDGLSETADPEKLLQAQNNLKQGIAKYKEFFAFAEKQSNPKIKSIAEGAKMELMRAETELGDINDALWPGPGTLGQMFQRITPAVPIIKMPQKGTGSGFLVNYGGRRRVVTNRHVVEGAENGFVLRFLANGEERLVILEPKTVTAIHKDTDLAIIDLGEKIAEIEDLDIHPLRLVAASQDPKVMDELWVVGHPGLVGTEKVLRHTSTRGEVTGIIKLPEFGLGHCIQTNAAINRGNSGGPVFNKQGRVIGVAAAGAKHMQMTNFVVHVDMVRDLLSNKFNVGEKEIARIVTPTKTLPKEFKKVAKELAAEGFKPVRFANGKSHILLKAPPRSRVPFPIKLKPGREYVAVLIGASTNKASIDICPAGKKKVKTTTKPKPTTQKAKPTTKPGKPKKVTGKKEINTDVIAEGTKDNSHRIEVRFTPKSDKMYILTVANEAVRAAPVPYMVGVFVK